jgi:superoxide dismutase, Fe-Mn family
MAEFNQKYTPKSFPHLKGLKGISDGLLATHFKLYEGYVNRTNGLNERLQAMAKEGKASGKDPVYAELTRRMGFEYSGVVLHELYFENMKPGSSRNIHDGSLKSALTKCFGSVDAWLADFTAVATMPGIGWAVMFQNPMTGSLSNHWVSLHQDNQPAGFAPVLVMDAWEHAFLPDYAATDRAKYVEAFLDNVDWQAAEKRLK